MLVVVVVGAGHFAHHAHLQFYAPLKKRKKGNRLILLYKGLKGKARIPTDDLIMVWCRPLTHVIISQPKNPKDGLRLNNSVTISVQI